MLFPLKYSKSSQNEARGREGLFTQANLRPQKCFISFSVLKTYKTYKEKI